MHTPLFIVGVYYRGIHVKINGPATMAGKVILARETKNCHLEDKSVHWRGEKDIFRHKGDTPIDAKQIAPNKGLC
jgi:hypothetical protein